jgi:hypothetical protein
MPALNSPTPARPASTKGMLTVNADDQLPVGTDLVLAGVDPTNIFGRAPTLNREQSSRDGQQPQLGQ